MHPALSKVLLDEAALQARIKELGAQITRDYAGKRLLVVGVLKGSVIFLADLLRQIGPEVDVYTDFVAVSSYAGKASTGAIRTLLDLRDSPEGKDLLLVEDIVDTGLTLTYLQDMLRTRGPKSLRTACLLSKPSRRKVDVKVEYIGFTIEDRFVVGYGLDYAEQYRNLPHIAVLG